MGKCDTCNVGYNAVRNEKKTVAHVTYGVTLHKLTLIGQHVGLY